MAGECIYWEEDPNLSPKEIATITARMREKGLKLEPKDEGGKPLEHLNAIMEATCKRLEENFPPYTTDSIIAEMKEQ